MLQNGCFRRVFILMFSMAFMLLNAGCASPVKGLYPPSQGEKTVTVYVLWRGLHTGLIVGSADIPPGLWPQHKEFASAKYIEVGWGDTEAYRFPWTAPIVLRALFHSRGSVVLVHAFSNSFAEEYAGIARDIVAVRLSEPGFERMCVYIQKTYALDAQGRPIPLASEYADENFLVGTGHYSGIHNCNNWTAGALRAAGCPIAPGKCVLPGTVIRTSSRFGQVIWRNGKPVKTDGQVVFGNARGDLESAPDELWSRLNILR